MLNHTKLGISGGILWGLSMFICTIPAMYFGYFSKFLNIMADIYPGYTISWLGAALLHNIGIDAETQDIICCELTGNDKGDAEVAEQMLGKLPCKVKSVRGDGAYDAYRFRKKVHDKGGICIVPPPRDAAYKGTAETGWEKERDDAISAIHGFGGDDTGRRLWKRCSGYHERSLAETAMFSPRGFCKTRKTCDFSWA